MLDEGRVPPSFPASRDYARPAWKRGWELAERTRALMGVDPVAPILSVRALIDRINIPLIQAELGHTFAGATVQNGADRGIVVNIQGDNTNVWVRRVTLCHELGHLLWDPADQLQHLHVDSYQDISTISETGIEARANAFAIAFLAPPAAVREIVKLDIPAEEQVGRLMQRLGWPARRPGITSRTSRENGALISTRHMSVLSGFHNRTKTGACARTGLSISFRSQVFRPIVKGGLPVWSLLQQSGEKSAWITLRCASVRRLDK